VWVVDHQDPAQPGFVDPVGLAPAVGPRPPTVLTIFAAHRTVDGAKAGAEVILTRRGRGFLRATKWHRAGLYGGGVSSYSRDLSWDDGQTTWQHVRPVWVED